MQLLLVRHAESLGNRERRLQGRREYPLTERGERQSEVLKARLAPMPLAAVYASPMRRAMETAEPLAAQTGLTVRLEPRVQEYDFGAELSGLTWKEIRDRQPEIVEALRSGGPDFPRYPGEEGRETFRERVCSAVWEIAARHEADGAVAVVTHGGPIAVFVMAALGLPYRHPQPLRHRQRLADYARDYVPGSARLAAGGRRGPERHVLPGRRGRPVALKRGGCGPRRDSCIWRVGS